MENSYIFLFSGQGSQYYHMGSEFFGKEPVFTTWMKKLDSLVYEMTGQSVLDRLYSPELKRTDKFDSIQFTHPAIFMVEYSLAQSLMENGVKPDYVLGASLGEFAAAALAGVMSVEDIMECIVKQAQVFAKYCHEGGMMAVMCEPAVFDSTPILYENSELVSINYHSHFVIASDNAKLHKIAGYLKNEGILSHKLPVSFAFHSSHIEAAKEPYIRFLRTKSNTRPRIPFVSSLYGKKIDSLQENYFWDIVRGPIKFTAALKQLEEGTDGSRVYVDLGPSGTLSNFAKYNLRAGSESSCIALMDPLKRDMEGFEKVRRLLKNKKSFSSERKVINMRAYVFPGQGSQQKGMGKGLFAEFSDYTAAADKILGYSIERLCIEDPENQLGQTQFTQPALYVVNALSYLKKVAETGEKPDYVAGHSLGEYDALFAAGVFDFETGLKIVKKRGELMSQARNGGMAAVMGMSEEKIKEVLKDNNLESIDVANFNTPSQIVISGPKDDILKAQPAFEKAGAARYIPLAVSGAFHSRYMSSAKNEFSEFISQFEFSEATIPVVSNYTARPYKRTEVLRNMVEQITGSVKWCETIRYLMGKGDISIEQVGPGSALTGMIRAIQKEAQPLIVVDEDRDDEIPEEKAPVYETEYEQEPVSEEAFKGISPLTLGNRCFKERYNLKYAYLAGGMYKAISSKEMVVRMGKAGCMGFFGTGGLTASKIEEAILYIKNQLKKGEAYGMNLVHHPNHPEKEEDAVDLFLKHGVKTIEISAFLSIMPSVARYKLKGLRKDANGEIIISNRIIAKVSRPEVAEVFLSPIPQRIIEKLLKNGSITEEEAKIAKNLPFADDLCIEADSGGHTDGGNICTLMPAMLRLRDEMVQKYGYSEEIYIGAAGGIGTPESAAAAFMLGADFILTGSINQCTVEAGTSDLVKDLLQRINVQDTGYAPAADMFEMGARVQVVKKGLFFPARANKLYEVYRQYNSLDEIESQTRAQIQEKYFKRSFEEIYTEIKSALSSQDVEKAERNPKYKMAMVFKWYLNNSFNYALTGKEDCKVDCQVYCGPALGAFNQWVKHTALEEWKKRHVDEIGIKLMQETAIILGQRFSAMSE